MGKLAVSEFQSLWVKAVVMIAPRLCIPMG